jgi:cation transport ATPase
VAIGRRGLDLAVEWADAVMVRDDLGVIASVVALSHRGVVVANLVIAATVSTALVAWDLVVTLLLPLGVAGHEGSTVVVGLNGL